MHRERVKFRLTSLRDVAFSSGRQADHDHTYPCVLNLNTDAVSSRRHDVCVLFDSQSSSV
jgi:hypothetical protein